MHAAWPVKPWETFLDAMDAGRDYVDQGEYKNEWGGAQVIARVKAFLDEVVPLSGHTWSTITCPEEAEIFEAGEKLGSVVISVRPRDR